jgi:membrane fusion protein (multidrug efflux system)
VQTAKATLEALQQSQRAVLNQLGGNAEAAIDSYAPYLAAKAAVAKAQWNLDQTVVKAPMDGIATQVANIQMGRYLAAGTAVFAIVSGTDVWIDANPKETDITYLAAGLPVSITIDAFPDHPLKGQVASISPGTGAVFSIIPAQNAAGNWVKVVQRVPVRVTLENGQDLSFLRTGMSANVSIDTGRVRSLGSLLGIEAIAHVKPE